MTKRVSPKTGAIPVLIPLARGLLVALGILLAGAAAPSGAPHAQTASPNACAATNVPCRCSFLCCGEERCDGSVCNQCVIDCVERRQTADNRSASLRSRCQSLMSRGFKRL